jgi:hypothetical protein
VKGIGGFGSCTLIYRIEIPSSVEIISTHGFCSCSSVTEVLAESECHVRDIGRFFECRSLWRIEIVQSVEVISAMAFSECVLLRLVEFSRDSGTRKNLGFRGCRGLIVSD